MKISILTSLLFSLTILFSSCLGDEEPNALVEPLPTISEFIESNNLNTEITSSGLNYIIKEQGGADRPTTSSTITINYRGYLLNGEVFDARDNQTFPLNNLIQGWQEGIPLIGEGGEIQLLIPSNLAYGSRGAGSIPPNTDIGFDIRLISFQ